MNESFYVFDGLTGTDSTEEAFIFQAYLQEFFGQDGFTPYQIQKSSSRYWEWNGMWVFDHFFLTFVEFPSLESVIKHALISDVAKYTFNILG